MRIVAEFDDGSRNRKVNYKSKRVVVDRTLHFAVAATKTSFLFTDAALDNPRSLYISSDFTLDSETYSTKVEVADESAVVLFTFYLYPGQASVIPLPSNASSLIIYGLAIAPGNIRTVVTDNV